MSKIDFAKQAKRECCELSVHPGLVGSVPFWNIEATQFMYAPSFDFAGFANCNEYRFDATDETGKSFSFVAPRADALLSPIWAELADGRITLTVTALNGDGLAGSKTFCKVASFRNDIPKAVCPYTECVQKAFEFTMTQPFVQHWLKYGTPDPCYDLNTYPSKITSSLINAMIDYAAVSPEHKNEAMKVAVTAADYLIDITPRGEHPLANLPPTYYFDFCPDPVKCGIADSPNFRLANKYKGTVMMIYPAEAGEMYIKMYIATGEKKYLAEAEKIGSYYVNNIQENGSWYLVLSEETGKPTAENYVAPMERVVPYLMDLFGVTNNIAYKVTAEKAANYTKVHQLDSYNWEGQFEDTGTSQNYSNLSQYGPVGYACYLAKYFPKDSKALETAKELMRFAEDQFVVWGRPFPAQMPLSYGAFDNSDNYTVPCALEQYRCYCPIDASAAHIINGFLTLYEAGCGDIYLAKARALADQITRVQHENGQIPTFWMHTPEAESNFWFNCMFFSCRTLMAVEKYGDVEI